MCYIIKVMIFLYESFFGHIFIFKVEELILWIELPWPENLWCHLRVIWTGGSFVEFRHCNLWSLVRSPVVEIMVYTADET